ncbi:MAG: hypothetical protein AAGJ35_00865 [Myxococcota bacterium]
MSGYRFAAERIRKHALSALNQVRDSLGLGDFPNEETPHPSYPQSYYQRLFSTLIKSFEHTTTPLSAQLRWSFYGYPGMPLLCCPLYLSGSERLMLWGTPMHTQGTLGRLPSQRQIIVLDGEIRHARPSCFVRERVRAGEQFTISAGHSELIEVPDHLWVLEYARGWTTLSFSMELLELWWQRLDLSLILQHCGAFGRLQWQNWSRLWNKRIEAETKSAPEQELQIMPTTHPTHSVTQG